jgi:hypothetical protein
MGHIERSKSQASIREMPKKKNIKQSFLKGFIKRYSISPPKASKKDEVKSKIKELM